MNFLFRWNLPRRPVEEEKFLRHGTWEEIFSSFPLTSISIFLSEVL